MVLNIPPDFGLDDLPLEEVVIPSELRAARAPEARILAELEQYAYEEEERFAVKLAFEEALTNAVKHGNRNDTSKQLAIGFAVTPEQVVIGVRDEGGGFQLADVPDPTADENLERPSGRGIMLMTAYMTRVQYNEQGNEVWMLMRRRA